MRRPTIVAGIDVGTTKILTVIAEAQPGAMPVILGVGKSPSRGLKKGVVVDLPKTREAIEDSVARAERMAGVSLDSVYVGVTGSHIRSMNTSGAITISNPDHEITENDRQRVLEEARLLALPPDRKILHLVEQEYVVDGQEGVENPVGMSGHRLEVRAHVITGSTNFLSNVAKCVEQVDLGVMKLVLEPIASAEAVLEDAEKSVGVVLVDIGGGTSDLAVFREGVLHFTRVIPIGSRHLDNDLCVCLGVSPEEAERLKVEHGTVFLNGPRTEGEVKARAASGQEELTLEKHLIAEVLEARMMELLELVRQAVTDSGFERLAPGGVVFTGGGSMIWGLKELAEETLGLKVRVSRPKALAAAKEIPPELWKTSAAATGLGLVLYGAKQLTHPRDFAPRLPLKPGGLLEWLRRWIEGLGHG